MRLSRPCLTCGRRTEPGRSRCRPCEATRRRPENRRSSARRRVRLHQGDGDGAARRLRREIKTQGGVSCIRCGAFTPTPLVEVDHSLPLHRGGTDVDDNVAPMCQPCHRTKTAADLGC